MNNPLPLSKLDRYQKDAVMFLLRNPESGLAIDLSLGKTVISLVYIRRLVELNRTRRFLVVAPINVMFNTWPQEISKWQYINDLNFNILHGSKKDVLLKDKSVNVNLINYSGLLWLHKQLEPFYNKFKSGKVKFPWGGIILDESTKLKDPSTGRFKKWKKYFKFFKYSHILTATPIPLSLENIWSQWYVVDKGKAFGPAFTSFRSRYFKKINDYVWVPEKNAKKEIFEKTKNKLVVLKADKLIDLPPMIYNRIYLSLPPAIQKQYDILEKEYFLELDGNDIEALNNADRSNKLRQLIQGQIYNTEVDIKVQKKIRTTVKSNSVKLDQIKHLIEWYQGDPVIIVINYQSEVEALRKVYGPKLAVINSETSRELTDKHLDDWNHGKLEKLVVHPKSISHGLNLQDGGRRVLWSALTTSPETFLQLNGRLKRRNQKRKVIIDILIMRKTIDELIITKLRSRGRDQESYLKAIREYKRMKGF